MGSPFGRLLRVIFCYVLLFWGCAGVETDSSKTQWNVESISRPPVRFVRSHGEIVLDNGLLQLTLSTPGGEVIVVKYNGMRNLLEAHNSQAGRGYLDLVWNSGDKKGVYDNVQGTEMAIIQQTDDVVELSFTRRWSQSSSEGIAPLIIDRRYIMLRGSSGFYTYAIFDHPEGWPEFDLGSARVAFKLDRTKFRYMAVSDKRQRIMPTASDRSRGQKLGYPEAVLLTNPSNPNLKGEVDDKYQYSVESQDDRVHGWISHDPTIGFWMITPSYEFRTCGPLKQDLTSHVGPTTLGAFMSNHYGGRDMDTKFQSNESWKKVFGPVMVYVNSAPSNGDANAILWNDAKEQMLKEVQSWPYNFVGSKDYPSSSERGTVSGRLMIRDRFLNENDAGADHAYVGLAPPGDVGSWQKETKGYQFWTRANKSGNFVIKSVRAGVYNLYAWVPGVIGDYKYEGIITITPGSEVQVGTLVYSPPRRGPTLWEIGIPDRSAAEFYVPDPNPIYVNKLFLHDEEDKFRQYGLWERYADLYPTDGLVYTVGVSNYSKDWFYAHVTRDVGNKQYVPTTRQIRFELEDVDLRGTYTLQVALASSVQASLQFRFNDPNTLQPHRSTRAVGWDNAIARHGIHGLYWLFTIAVPGYLLRRGTNTIYVTQPRAVGPYQGCMYDYIRLEGPPSTA